MKIAQLIKVSEEVIYKNENGGILETLTPKLKLLHILTKPDLYTTTKSEEVIESWKYKTKKEIDLKFWDYINNNNLDARNYHIII